MDGSEVDTIRGTVAQICTNLILSSIFIADFNIKSSACYNTGTNNAISIMKMFCGCSGKYDFINTCKH